MRWKVTVKFSLRSLHFLAMPLGEVEDNLSNEGIGLTKKERGLFLKIGHYVESSAC